MKPEVYAQADPNRPAIIMTGSGHVTTFRELESDANRFARLLRDRGLRRGDHVAVMLENDPHFYVVVWGALRSGIYVTPINWHLGPAETGYIVEDCEAEAVVISGRFATSVAPQFFQNVPE